MNLADYKKIMLVGIGGSGKSWLATQIAKRTGYPVYHLDKEFWQPNWVLMPADEQFALVQNIITQDCWIIEGNWGKSMEIRFAAADLIIFMDINRFYCVVSAAKRLKRVRPDFPDYLDQGSIFGKQFRELALHILWNFHKGGRKLIIRLHKKYPEKKFLHFKNRRKAAKILEMRQ